MNKFLKNSAIIISIGAILFTGIISVKDYFNSPDLSGALPPPTPNDIEMAKELLDLDNNPIETASFGDTVKYKITITNNSSSELTDVEIEDILPELLTFVISSDPTYAPDADPDESDN